MNKKRIEGGAGGDGIGGEADGKGGKGIGGGEAKALQNAGRLKAQVQSRHWAQGRLLHLFTGNFTLCFLSKNVPLIGNFELYKKLS